MTDRERSFFKGLHCRNDEILFEPDQELYSCPHCHSYLNAMYDYDRIKKVLNRERARNLINRGVWGFFELLPVLNRDNIISLGEGNTPLIQSTFIGPKLNLSNLYWKLESVNPNGSFKDRQVTVGITKAIEFGHETVIVGISSGNVGASTSAYAARAGIEARVIFWKKIPRAGDIQVKINHAVEHQAKTFAMNPDLTPSRELAGFAVNAVKEKAINHQWVPLLTGRTINPYLVEGAKTIAFEILCQLNFEVPDWLVLPVGGGSLLSEIWKGAKEFYKLDLVVNLPRIAAAGPESSPVPTALANNTTLENIYAKSNQGEIPPVFFAPDGDIAFDSVKESQGTGVQISEKEVKNVRKILAAKEGILPSHLGSWATAGVVKLARAGLIKDDDLVVAPITATGLREIPKFGEYSEKIKELDETDLSCDQSTLWT